MKTVEDVRVAMRHPKWIPVAAKKVLFRLGVYLRDGQIIIQEGSARHTFGQPTAQHPNPVTIAVHDPAFYADAVLGGVIGFAESYIDGRWSTPDLPGLLRIVMHNEDLYASLDRGVGTLLQPFRNVLHAFRHNSEKGSRRNIMAHYDLGNDFFATFLDETMAYSSAFFEQEDMSLADASRAKFDRLCRRLALQPTDHLLEIGTGWGGFALYAARTYGCRVTTTTISPAQRAWAQKQVEAAGLQDRIKVLGQDYRKLEGQYDKLVSIEMIEAVGHHYLKTFFGCCSALLKPEGLMGLQAITVPNRWYAQHKRRATFINQYVFPGSCLPSDIAMLHAMARSGDLELLYKEDMSAHYAKTLSAWRTRFFNQMDTIRKVWPSKAFIRTWDVYFASCEAGFAERDIQVGQYLLAKSKAKPRLSYAV